MALQIVAAYETLAAMIALELPIPEVRLNVRFDVLFSTESPVTAIVRANPFVVFGIRTGDICCDVIQGDTSVFDGRINSGIKIE
jgi:hypothetical protein